MNNQLRNIFYLWKACTLILIILAISACRCAENQCSIDSPENYKVEEARHKLQSSIDELITMHQHAIKNFELTEQERLWHEEQMKNLLEGMHAKMSVYKLYIQELYAEKFQDGWKKEEAVPSKNSAEAE